jgi:DNA-binding winged helix-turn-helix (wHTH) protein
MSCGIPHPAIMSRNTGKHRKYSFGVFTLDVDLGTPIKSEHEVRLRPQSFAVLRILLRRPGCLVHRRTYSTRTWLYLCCPKSR